MKFKVIVCFLFSLSLCAENFSARKISEEKNLTFLIERMKNAEAKDRYIYMNKIKIILREMNQEERAKIIKELRKSFKKKNSGNISNKKQNSLNKFKQHEMKEKHRRYGHGKR